MPSFLDGEIPLAKVAQKQTFSGMLVSSFYCRYNSYYVRRYKYLPKEICKNVGFTLISSTIIGSIFASTATCSTFSGWVILVGVTISATFTSFFTKSGGFTEIFFNLGVINGFNISWSTLDSGIQSRKEKINYLGVLSDPVYWL